MLAAGRASHNGPMPPPQRFDLSRDDPSAARDAAAAALERGELVVLPTETVYGLAAREDRPAALRRLEVVKHGRLQPYSLAVASPEMLADRLAPLPRLARRIADRWWPGPVTQLLPTRDGPLVGVRVPGHAWTRELIAQVGVPLLLPSANPPGEAAPRDAGGIDGAVLEPRAWVLRVAREGVIGRGDLERQILPRILIVCSGNTCRSPIAQKLLERELRRAAGEEWMVPVIESAGLQAMPGLSATELSIEALAARGLDLSGHRTRPVDRALLERTDLALGMTIRHVELLRDRTAGRPLPVELFDPAGHDVEDPFGGTAAEYRSVTVALERMAQERARQLLEAST